MPELLNNLATQLWNCEHAFSNLCPKLWSELSPTDKPGVRFCSVCSENVTYCTTPEDFVQLGNAGKCVAVPDQLTPDCFQRMRMGRPSVKQMESYRDRQQRTANWWHDVIERGPSFGDDQLKEISKLALMQRSGGKGLSEEYREYLVKIKEAISSGPEAFYRHIRIKPNGKRDNQQNIFRLLRHHFDLTYRECKKLADRVEAADTQ